LGFLAALSLEKTPLQPYSAYADPAIVISLVLLTAPVILKIIFQNTRELLWGAPDLDMQHRLDCRIREILRPYGLDTHWLRLLKLGRRIYLNLYLLVPSASILSNVDQFDTIREKILTACQEEVQNVTVDVLFTRQSKWAE
jgi:predicted Co/Zn/Cd cation transporter (cation efflux family)